MSFTYINHGTYIEITGYTGIDPDMIIPSELEGLPVTTIKENSFNGNTTIVSVVIPNSILNIKYNAFYSCTNLESVSFGTNITTTGGGVFFGCTSLDNVSLPNSITTIRYSCFYGCSSLTNVTLGNAVTRIEDNAFMYTNISSIVFPNTLSDIWEQAFTGTQLVSIEIPPSVTAIKERVFQGCSNLVSVSLPSTITEIRTNAFYGCAFSEITIGESISSLGYRPFSNNPNLETIKFVNADAPSANPTYTFEGVAPGVTIYRYASASGWTDPWMGVPCKTISELSSSSISSLNSSSSSKSSLSSISSQSSLSSKSSSTSSESSLYGYLLEPTSLLVESITPDTRQIVISWEWSNEPSATPQIPTGFIIERSVGGGAWGVVTEDVDGNERTYTDTLDDSDAASVFAYGQTFRYRIKSYWIP